MVVCLNTLFGGVTLNSMSSGNNSGSSFTIPKPPAASGSDSKQVTGTSSTEAFKFNFSGFGGGATGGGQVFKLNFLGLDSKPTDSKVNSGSSDAKPTEGLKFNFGGSSGTSGGGLNFGFGSGTFNFGSLGGTTIKFHFGTGKEFTSTKDPKLSFVSEGTTLASGSIPQGEDSAESSETTILLEETRAGEEGEERLIEVTGKLLELVDVVEKDGDTEKKERRYVERGVGPFHINKGESSYRLAMRRSKVGTALLNMRVFPQMNPKQQGSRVTFMGVNAVAAPATDDKGEGTKVGIYCLRVKAKEDAEKIVEILNQAIKSG